MCTFFSCHSLFMPHGHEKEVVQIEFIGAHICPTLPIHNLLLCYCDCTHFEHMTKSQKCGDGNDHGNNDDEKEEKRRMEQLHASANTQTINDPIEKCAYKKLPQEHSDLTKLKVFHSLFAFDNLKRIRFDFEIARISSVICRLQSAMSCG